MEPLFGSADEKETADANTPEKQGSERTQFKHSKPPSTSCDNLTDHLTLLEEETDTTITAVAKELKSDVGLLETRLTDFLRKAKKRINNEVGALSNYLVPLKSLFVKVEDERAKIQHYLDGKTETFSKLNQA